MGALAALAGLAPACDGAGDCVEVPADCTPQYEPTFDGVWANTLSTSCALSGCHGEPSGASALSMGADPQGAFAALQGYVVPGDPGCSALVVHLEPTAAGGLGDMPPGAPLSEEERCAVRTWIAEGAEP